MAERKAKLDAKKAASKARAICIASAYAVPRTTTTTAATPLRDATAPEDLTGASSRSRRSTTRSARAARPLIHEQANGGAVVVRIEEGAALVLSMSGARERTTFPLPDRPPGARPT